MYRIEGRRGTYREQRDLAEHLQERGEYGLSERVRRGYDLLPSELSRAAGTFDESGLMRGYDYVVSYVEEDEE